MCGVDVHHGECVIEAVEQECSDLPEQQILNSVRLHILVSAKQPKVSCFESNHNHSSLTSSEQALHLLHRILMHVL